MLMNKHRHTTHGVHTHTHTHTHTVNIFRDIKEDVSSMIQE